MYIVFNQWILTDYYIDNDLMRVQK